MYFVYILRSITTNKYYIGCTNNVNKRLKEHNEGKVFSTKPLRPFKLVLMQEYSTLSMARRIELRLKKLKRRDYIEKIIKDQYIKMGS